MNYTQYSNEELLESYTTKMEYSGKIDADLNTEIQSRGGIERIKYAIREKNIKPDEARRIAKEIIKYNKDGSDFDFIKSSITSEILSKEEIEQVIEQTIGNIKSHHKDTAITSKTIVNSLIGMLLSTIICSGIWFYSVATTGTMYYFLIAIFLLISYIIIRLITRKSSNNIVVFLATFFSAFLAIIFGTMLLNYAEHMNG